MVGGESHAVDQLTHNKPSLLPMREPFGQQNENILVGNWGSFEFNIVIKWGQHVATPTRSYAVGQEGHKHMQGF